VHFNQCFNAENSYFRELTAPFFDHERFIIPKKYAGYIFYKKVFLHRRLKVLTERLLRMVGILPRQIWLLVTKYYVYRTTNDLTTFAEVALGNRDCNIKDVLSVGGFWTEENQRYLDTRRKKREMLDLEHKLDLLIEQNPELAKGLKRQKRE